MAGGFDNGVATPGAASYSAPLLNFANFGNWANDFIQGEQGQQQVGLNDQQKAMNQQRIAEAQRQADLAKTFQGGLPRDKDGNIDYKTAVSMLAQKGDISALWNGADAMAALSPVPQSGLLQPQGGGQSPQGAQPPPAPQSVPAKPLPPVATNSPQGDPGSGTVTDLVTDKLSQDTRAGQAIIGIAGKLGVDPNATLTPGQLRRAQGLLQKYAPADGAGGGNATNLPPSANAVSPATKITPATQPAARPAPGGQPPAGPGAVPPPAAPPPAQAQPPQQPQPQGGGPVVPQVPLPKGFTDPQQAILALRAEAAKFRSMPRGRGEGTAGELDAYAKRIEDSIKPLQMGANMTLVDPQTGRPVYQPQQPSNEATIDADAERYRQTGTLPPNMGRGIQGQREAAAIRARAAEQEINAGGDPANWPSKWQDFKAAGVGKSTAERTKASREENLNLILKAADAAIPAALEANKALPRDKWVPWNKLYQKGEIMASDPQLVEFGMANLQLAEHWARAMNPTGVMRESDRDLALKFLDTGFSNKTYERAVLQLQKQITRERDAVRGGGTTLKDGKAPDPADPGKSQDWVRRSDGTLGPAQ